MRLLIPFFLLAALASAQVVSVGVKAGVPLTDAVPSYQSNSGMLDTGRWTVGPTIEFKLVKNLSVEVDALYRGYREQQTYVSEETTIPAGNGLANPITLPATYSSSFSKAKVWDVPLLLKYRFGSGPYRPFVDAGATYSHTTSDGTSTFGCLSGATLCASNPYASYFAGGYRPYSSSENSVGPTGGAGVEVKVGKFKLAPEVRYTHLSNPKRNLVTLMVGFTY